MPIFAPLDKPPGEGVGDMVVEVVAEVEVDVVGDCEIFDDVLVLNVLVLDALAKFDRSLLCHQTGIPSPIIIRLSLKILNVAEVVGAKFDRSACEDPAE